jgi:hypothetical protein
LEGRNAFKNANFTVVFMKITYLVSYNHLCYIKPHACQHKGQKDALLQLRAMRDAIDGVVCLHVMCLAALVFLNEHFVQNKWEYSRSQFMACLIIRPIVEPGTKLREISKEVQKIQWRANRKSLMRGSNCTPFSPKMSGHGQRYGAGKICTREHIGFLRGP